MAGGGTASLSIGTSQGASDLMPVTAIAALAAGATLGLASTEIGTAFLSADLYNAKLAAGTQIWARITAPVGTVSTAAVVKVRPVGVLQS